MPGIKSLFKKKEKTHNNTIKLNIATVFVHNDKQVKSTIQKPFQEGIDRKVLQFDKLLDSEIIDIEKLKKLAWNGIPPSHRSKVWKILMKYTSTNKDNHQHFLNTKRRDYFHMVDSYFNKPEAEFDSDEKKVLKLIHDDVIRTAPQSSLFRQAKVQQMLKRYFFLNSRILYVWHVRHPSSGYVQGLNDIAIPFLIVFLSDHLEISLKNVNAITGLGNINQLDLKNVQADSYWCFTKILNQVLDNYTTTWPGIQKSFVNIKDILNRVDPGLLKHIQARGIDFYHIYFKWVTCLLLRQFSPQIGLRLFDSYISLEASQGTFFNFIQYIFVAIFLKFSKQLKKLNFQDLMAFEHKMPTKTWEEEQVSTIIAEAFVYQNFFNNQ